MIEFDNNLPIYMQIMSYLKGQIINGSLKPGERIPSVRELATDLQINPNTVQRTFSELEREGIVITKRGLGRYVTSEESVIMNIKHEMAGELINQFISGMKELGFENNDISNIVDKVLQSREGRE